MKYFLYMLFFVTLQGCATTGVLDSLAETHKLKSYYWPFEVYLDNTDNLIVVTQSSVSGSKELYSISINRDLLSRAKAKNNYHLITLTDKDFHKIEDSSIYEGYARLPIMDHDNPPSDYAMQALVDKILYSEAVGTAFHYPDIYQWIIYKKRTTEEAPYLVMLEFEEYQKTVVQPGNLILLPFAIVADVITSPLQLLVWSTGGLRIAQ